MPESGPLVGTLIDQSTEPEVEKDRHDIAHDVINGPSLSQPHPESDCVRESFLSLSTDARTDQERLTSAVGREHHAHMKLGKAVPMWKKEHWVVSI